MTRISKEKLKENVEENINKSFSQVILQLKENSKGKDFLDELFTETERVMFAKRLAIIMLLDKGASYYRISKMLKVSTSTIKRIHTLVLAGHMESIVHSIHSLKKRERLILDLEVIVRGGLPSMGKGRWKGVYKILDSKHKK